MTTDDTASSGKSATKESSAEAIRKAREGAITGEVLTSVRREIQSLAATMGGVSLSLLELQTSAKVQSETAEGSINFNLLALVGGGGGGGGEGE